jgi:hypothetical protein
MTEKLLQDFSVNNSIKDGRHTYCKKCESERVKNYYKKNKDKVRTRQSEYHKANVTKFREYGVKRYYQIKLDPEKYLKFKIRRSKSHERQSVLYPEKIRARAAVSHALKAGKINRPDSCSLCGKSCIPEAHHDSYEESQWLTVRWFCRQCHAIHHRKYPDSENIKKALTT